MKLGSMVKGVLVAAVAVMSVTSAMADLTGPAPLAWRWAPQSSGIPDGSPVVTPTAVFVGNGNRVYSVDRDSGNTMWRYPLSEPLTSKVAAPLGSTDKDVIVGLDDFRLIAVNMLTGKQTWSVTLEAKITTVPVYTNGTIVVGIGTGEIVALKAADGSRLWPKNFKPSEPMLPYLQGVNGSAFFISGRTINCLDVLSGKIKWHRNFGSFGGAVNVIGDKVYATSGTFVSVLSSESGFKIWEKQITEPFAAAPGANSRFVACLTRTGFLYAFDANGNKVFKKGVSIGATSQYPPVVNGSTATVMTQVGTLTMVDLLTGDIKWNTVIHPANTTRRVVESGLVARGNVQAQPEVKTPYIQATGAPVISGDSLFLLARDATLLAYDKNNGVDVTTPQVAMLFPNAGDTVSGKAPMTLQFRLDDWGVGVNQESVKVTINDKPYSYKLDPEGYLTVQISSDKKNPPIADGRAKIVIHVEDWLGNTVDRVLSLTIDNVLPALGGPKRPGQPAPTLGLPPAGGPTGGGGGGGDAGGDGG